MDTQEPKVKINARIDADLHRWIQDEGMTVSQATQEGITLLRETRAKERDTKADNGTQGSTQEHTHNTRESTQARDTKYTDNDVIVSQALKERIEDLKAQITLISTQLETKDDQITSLNEVTQKQAVHIQSLINENSKLNTKLLPEVTEKKPWWRFW